MSDSKRGSRNNEDDDDFDYGDALGHGGPVGGRSTNDRDKTTVVLNQPYDEAYELSDDGIDESVDTHAMSGSQASAASPAGGAARGGAGSGGAGNAKGGSSSAGSAEDARGRSPPPASAVAAGNLGLSGEYPSDSEGPEGPAMPPAALPQAAAPASSASSAALKKSESDARIGGKGDGASSASGAAAGGAGAGSSAAAAGGSAGESSASSPGGAAGSGVPNPGLIGIPPRKAAYNAADFAALRVPDEVKALFAHIGAYRPRNVELEPRLQCFIPDYIPAVGEIDAFVKVPRPDGAEDRTGLAFLDEPGPAQSDPTVLDLQLRTLSKRSGAEPVLVRAIEHADKNGREISRWIASVADVHRSRPPPTVPYSKPMPDIERLMQEWPPGFEELLRSAALPGADLDLSLEEYAKAVCALLDIPVHAPSTLVQSLHVLFSLYADFKDNAHFARAGAAAAAAAAGAGAGAGGGGAADGSGAAAGSAAAAGGAP